MKYQCKSYKSKFFLRDLILLLKFSATLHFKFRSVAYLAEGQFL
jgi:hypothetical protein